MDSISKNFWSTSKNSLASALNKIKGKIHLQPALETGSNRFMIIRMVT